MKQYSLILTLFLLATLWMEAQDFHTNFNTFVASPSATPKEIGFTNGLSNHPSAVAQFDFDLLAGPARGMLMPRMTTAQRTSISSPADGLIVYDTQMKCFYYWDSSIPNWVKIWSSGTGSLPNPNLWMLNTSTNEIFNTNFRQVGVGLNNPTSMLHVEDLALANTLNAQQIDFGTNLGAIGIFGLDVQAPPITSARGTRTGVRAATSSDNTAKHTGSATGSLAISKSFSGDGSFLGVTGNVNAAALSNSNTVPSRLLGGVFTVDNTTNLNLNGTGTINIGGTYAALSGTINGGTGNGKAAAVHAYDQNQGNTQSYSGYFLDQSYSGNTTDEAGLCSEFNVSGLVTADVPAVLGINDVEDFWGIGVRGKGGAIGVHGVNEADGSNSGFAYIGVQGDATYTPNACGQFTGYGTYGRSFNFNLNQGLRGEAINGNVNYGVYGEASSTCVGATNFAGYFNGVTFSMGGYQSSDKKFKQNVKILPDAMNKIMALRPSRYEYNQKKFDAMHFEEGEQYGFIAQELQEIFPTLVKESIHISTKQGKDGKIEAGEQIDFLAVNYVSLIPVLTKGIQEQQATIEDLKAENEDLKTRLDKLETAMASLLEQRSQHVASNAPVKVSNAALQQNQPNPFNEWTDISYFIPQQVKTAKLQIADASGKIVQEINIATRGEGKTTLDTTVLSSGNYYYTLILDSRVMDTKQMTRSNY